MELINSVITFLSQTTLLRWFNFPTWITPCDSHSPTLLYLFLSSDAIICSTMTLTPLGKCHRRVVKLKTGCPVTSHSFSYSHADWDCLGDYLRDVPKKESLASPYLMLLVSFVSELKLKLVYISLIVIIGSILIHLHGFELLVLLSYFIEITFFVCTKTAKFPNLK